MPRGLSLVELVVAALVLGVSAIPVLELIRASTVTLEITETEAAARTLAADVLERLAGPPLFGDPLLSRSARSLVGAEVAWDALVYTDAFLAWGYPARDLASLLDQAGVRIRISMERPFSHAALGTTTGMDCIRVTALWTDRGALPKEVTVARLVARR
jgi:hypothetical protein